MRAYNFVSCVVCVCVCVCNLGEEQWLKGIREQGAECVVWAGQGRTEDV